MSKIARAITLNLFSDPKGVENKATGSDYDPVTQADIEAEKALRVSILEAFPNDSIEGEELPDHKGSNEFSWTLDPIDGTRAFIAGVPVWSTLVALSVKDEARLGMIDLPALGKRYLGQIGDGVSKSWVEENGDKKDLKTAPCAEIRDGILGCTAPFGMFKPCLLYTSPSPRDATLSRMPSSA